MGKLSWVSVNFHASLCIHSEFSCFHREDLANFFKSCSDQVIYRAVRAQLEVTKSEIFCTLGQFCAYQPYG